MKHPFYIGLLALAGLLATTGRIWAVDPEAVNQAIQKGVKYLKSQQLEEGIWDHPQIGATALAGLALMHSGVPANDPAIRKAAAAVRASGITLTHDYSLALSILFLDIVGEEADIPLIQAMGIRLLAGQNSRGGWTYSCLGPDLSEKKQLAKLLQSQRPPLPPPPPPMTSGISPMTPPFNPRRPRLSQQNLAPLFLAQLERLKAEQMRKASLPDMIKDRADKVDKAADILATMDDNSNTQFALLALWVARRYGVPVDFALKQVEKRFRTSQNGDGGWGYRYYGLNPAKQGKNPSTAANTCAGLLALAAVYGIRNEEAQRLAGPFSQFGVPQDVRVGLMVPPPGQDPAVRAGFWYLRSPDWVSAARSLAGCYHEQCSRLLFILVGGARGCHLWSGDHWQSGLVLLGAEILLACQGAKGGWTDGRYSQGCCDTSFALLFLSRANLAHDLTCTLQGQAKDLVQLKSRDDKAWTSRSEPDRLTRTLQGQRKDQVKWKSGGTEFQPGKDSPGLRGDGKTSPTLASAPDNSAAALTAILVKTTSQKQEQALEQLREGKGAAYTEALAQAIPRLEGTAHKKAREALAERLARMTITTLGDKLTDQDLEVRRAAVLACAMRDDRTHCAR